MLSLSLTLFFSILSGNVFNEDIRSVIRQTVFETGREMRQGLYSFFYTLIYDANLIIDNVLPESDVKKRVIAEAKFFRAWAHFELVTLWGSAPAVDHVLTPSEYRLAPGNPADTWALIEKDLSEAIGSGMLPSKTNVDDKETGIRITKETAQAFLGKAYVFQGKWSEAATTLDLVINSGKYALYEGDYGDILKMKADYCRESILEVNIRFDVNNPVMDFTDLMTGWRFDNFVVSGVNPAYADIASDAGYGFFSPRKALYDAFVTREGAAGYRLNRTLKNYDFLKNEINLPLLGGKELYGNEGYFFWKNRILLSESIMGYPNFRGWQAENPRYMRYAEVLLLAAEAHLKNGGGKAAQWVNEIRRRAGLSPLGSVTMDDIKTEKRLELCIESIRYQDLVRWGDAPSVLAGQGKEVYSYNGSSATVTFTNSVYGFKAGKHELLPIPGRELMVNENMKQNPEW